MIRYFLREEKGVLILSNNDFTDIAYYHNTLGLKYLRIKEEHLSEKGIEIINHE